MFKCDKCEVLEDQVRFLREQNKLLMDRTIPVPFKAVPNVIEDGFYGDGRDQYVVYGQFGEKVLADKEIKLESDERA